MEIYDVKASESKFFGKYVDTSYTFPQVASAVHRKTGAILFAVKRNGKMQLNPGKSFYITGCDILYYICLTHEDDAAFTDDSNNNGIPDLTPNGVCDLDEDHITCINSNTGKHGEPFERKQLYILNLHQLTRINQTFFR